MAGVMHSNPMTPTEAMEVAIREIGGYGGEAIERAVYCAIGAAGALSRIGAISLDEDADWREAARKAGDAQRNRIAHRTTER